MVSHDTAWRNLTMQSTRSSRRSTATTSQAAYFRNVAVAHCDAQQFDQAIAANRKAIALTPQFVETHCNLAGLLQRSGRSEEAISAIEAALACDSRYPDAHYNLGTILQGLGRLPEAAKAYEEAVRLRPDFALAHNNLGNTYHELGKLSAAISSYRRAVEVQPDFAVALTNLGSVLQKQGHSVEAIACFNRAIQVRPDFAEAYVNLGRAYLLEGNLDKAEVVLQSSLSLAPNIPEAHFDLALVYLSQQRFAEGWREFPWRLKCKGIPCRDIPGPLWQGEDLRGSTLLVYAEEGFGDMFQMLRYVEPARRRVGRVLLEVHAPLLPLMRSSGYSDVIAAGTPLPAFDLRCPILNLPSAFATNLENMPRDVPYLHADPGSRRAMERQAARYAGFKVGIAWQGSRGYAFDRERSIPLRHFAPLAIEGVQLLSLQKNDGVEQLAEVANQFTVHNLAHKLDLQGGAFMDTAAVMKNLDLVITSDTAIAHLAGALGVPVWVALNKAPDWRWFLKREDSPWYPTMRLFRQATPGDWPGVFSRIAAELAQLSRASSTAKP